MEVTTLQEKAYGLIREAIASGEFKPGERLVEVRLAEKLHITRGLIREALCRLESDGMVARCAGVGVFVVDFDPESFMELCEVRIALESVAARRAAQRCSGVGAAQLTQQLEKLREKTKPDERGCQPLRADMIGVDMGFHLLIAEIGECPFVRQLLANQHIVQRMMMDDVPSFPPTLSKAEAEEIVEDHVRLVEAIIENREDEAAEVSREVLARVAEKRCKLISAGRPAGGTQ